MFGYRIANNANLAVILKINSAVEYARENVFIETYNIHETNGVALGLAKHADGLRIKLGSKKVRSSRNRISTYEWRRQSAASWLNWHEWIDLYGQAIAYRSSSGGVTFVPNIYLRGFYRTRPHYVHTIPARDNYLRAQFLNEHERLRNPGIGSTWGWASNVRERTGRNDTSTPTPTGARKTNVLSPWTAKLVPVLENRSWFYTVRSCGARATYNWLIDDTIRPAHKGWTISLLYDIGGLIVEALKHDGCVFRTPPRSWASLMNVCHEFNWVQTWDMARVLLRLPLGNKSPR